MRSNIYYVPGRRGNPPVSVYILEIVPARRDENIIGIKLSCIICQGKIVCPFIGSQGIRARRDISARLEHVYVPLESYWKMTSSL